MRYFVLSGIFPNATASQCQSSPFSLRGRKMNIGSVEMAHFNATSYGGTPALAEFVGLRRAEDRSGVQRSERKTPESLDDSAPGG
jgi:hypothetical protein